MEKRIEALENIIKSGNLKIESKEEIVVEKPEEKATEVVENFNTVETVETVENTETIETIENIETYEDAENHENIQNTEISESSDNNEALFEKVDLSSFKDVLKATIFKKTISKLFDESVKEIYYFPKEAFLHIDCKEYLFKFGSYKLDENHNFVVQDNTILNEFFTKINMPIHKSLTVYANFVE